MTPKISLLFFTKRGCPKCEALRPAFLNLVGRRDDLECVDFKDTDVDTPAGEANAAFWDVLTVPTILCLHPVTKAQWRGAVCPTDAELDALSTTTN